MRDEQVYTSNVPEYHLPTDLSFHQFITGCNPDDVRADKVILEDQATPHKTLTYGGLREAAATAAGGFVNKFGLKEGDAVAIISPNCVDWVLLAHSVMWFGGIVVGITHLASSYELQHYLTVAAAKLVVIDISLKPAVEEAIQAIAPNHRPQRILFLGSNDVNLSFPECVSIGQRSIPPLDLKGRHNHVVPAAVVFSPGTSGKPKGVLLSHQNLIAHASATRTATPEVKNCFERDVFFPPCAHMFGLLGAVVIPAFLGSYVMLMRQFVYKDYVEACARTRATTIKVVPAIAVAMSKDKDLEKLDLSSVSTVLCAGATLQAEVVTRLQQLLKGIYILQGYGMSETAVSSLRIHRSVEKAGSVGRLIPNTQMRLVDENMKDVPIGVTGEALIKGPQNFMGYRGDPKATMEAFHDGWLRTGDALKIDNDGFLWFQDRKKEMIKYKGNQVPPAELEDILQSHEHVAEAAVTAIWNSDQQTEIPIGYVVLQPAIKENERRRALEEIRKWVDSRVAPYKKIRGGLHYIEAIPKNPTGKVMRSHLPVRLEAARKTGIISRPAKL